MTTPLLPLTGGRIQRGQRVHATVRCLSAFSLALLLAACSTVRPWINTPISGDDPAPSAPVRGPIVQVAAQGPTPSIVAAVTLSGGGARAAAFGLGVLQELKATEFEWGGQRTTLLDQVGLVSGVSGGSILATYYAAFGDDVFTRFEREFMLADFQSSLVGRILSPPTEYRLTSPWYGRSNVLAGHLDTLYRGLTYGDLLARHRRPLLLVTATDLTTGAPFEFTPEQFALICSDLKSVPLSFAVASSSSVPLLLSPMTLRNYAGTCPQSRRLAEAARTDRNLSARLLHLITESYVDSTKRPYLHLVDGGLADNLGVRSLLDRAIAAGSLDRSFGQLPPNSVHKVVLISVNSERDVAERIDKSDKVPGTLQVLDSLVFGAGSRDTTETLAMMRDTARRWTEELDAVRGKQGSPFAADAQLYVISVSLHDVHESRVRQFLLQVPTALTILPPQVHLLEAAGRKALRDAPEFQQLRRSLGLVPRTVAVDHDTLCGGPAPKRSVDAPGDELYRLLECDTPGADAPAGTDQQHISGASIDDPGQRTAF